MNDYQQPGGYSSADPGAAYGASPGAASYAGPSAAPGGMSPGYQSRTVVQRPGDPYLYLWVGGEWYCYNPSAAPLGSGAMGDVYVGYRCRNGVRVAIKRVKDAYASVRQIRQRAEQEAALAFRHPNLVEMVGLCEYAPDHGPIFMISHFVEGENSDKFVATLPEGPGRLQAVCGIGIEILDALDYLHAKGVVHRDIKPSNIMVERTDRGPHARLMDLGISRMSGGNKFSQFGFIGTPQYAAPEQITRKDSTVDAIGPATDIYALGITLYELLTGANPMDCPTDADTLAHQLKKPLPPHPDIPRSLMSILLRATQKDQQRRYVRAADMKQALERFIYPSTSVPKGSGGSVGTGSFTDWVLSHTVAVILGVIGLAILLAVIIAVCR